MPNEIKIALEALNKNNSLDAVITRLESVYTLVQNIEKKKDILTKLGGDVGKIIAVTDQLEKQRLALEAVITTMNKQAVAEEKLKQAKLQTQISQDKADISKVKSDQVADTAAKKKQDQIAKENDQIQKQSGILGQLQLRIQALNKEKIQAKTEDELKKINKEIEETKKKYNELSKSGTEGTNKWSEALGSFQFKFNSLAHVVGDVIERVAEGFKDFAVESFKLYAQAQENERKLGFAVTTINGESERSFEELKKQAEDLSEQLDRVYTPSQIEAAQSQLANFGLTSDKIATLIPQILDMSRATGNDLTSSTEKAILAINGQTKGLRDVGITFKDTGSKNENYIKLTKELEKFTGSATDSLKTEQGALDSLSGRWEYFKEMVGGFIADEGKGLELMLEIWDKGITQVADENAMKVFNKKNYDEEASFLDQIKKLRKDQQEIVLQQQRAGFQKLIAENEAAADKEVDIEKKTGLLKVAELQKSSLKAVDDYQKSLEAKDNLINDATTKEKKQLKDLSSEILDLQAKRYKDGIDRAKKELAVLEKINKEHIEKTVLDEKTKNDKLIAIDYQYYDDIAALQKAQLKYEAEIEIQKVEKEYASAEQKNELIKQINLKLLDDLAEVDRQGGIDKLEAKKEEDKKYREQIDANNDLILQTQKDFYDNETALDEVTNNRAKLALEKALEEKRITQEEYNKKVAEQDLASAKAKATAQIEEDQAELYRLQQTIIEKQRLGEDESADVEKADAARKKLELDQLKTDNDIAKAELDVEKAKDAEIKKLRTDLVDSLTDLGNKLFERQQVVSDARITQLDTEQQAQDKILGDQKQRAEQGLSNTLAFEEKQSAEIKRQLIKEQKEQQKIKELEVFFNAFAEYAKKDPDTAALKAGRDVVLGRIISGEFREGGIVGDVIERKGLGGSVDNKGLIKGRTHEQGHVIIAAEKDEGLFSTKEMRNLGRGNFYALKQQLKNPFNNNLFQNQNESFVSFVSEVKEDKASNKLVEKIDELIDVEKNRKETSINANGLREFIVAEVEHGVKKITIKKPRPW